MYGNVVSQNLRTYFTSNVSIKYVRLTIFHSLSIKLIQAHLTTKNDLVEPYDGPVYIVYPTHPLRSSANMSVIAFFSRGLVRIQKKPPI